MSRRTLIVCSSLLFLLTGTGIPAQSSEGGPLGPRDVSALVHAGVDEDIVIEELRRRTFERPLDAKSRDHLIAIGTTRNVIEEIDRLAAPRRIERPDLEIRNDDVNQLTWCVPAGWKLDASSDEGRFLAEDSGPTITATIHFKVLSPPPARLRALGIQDLDELHERRIAEIGAEQGRNWKRVGTWPLQALGMTGLHTVFEDALQSTRRSIRCLTWYSCGTRILSVLSNIEGPRGTSTLDTCIDGVTTILSEVAIGHLAKEEVERLRAAREDAELLLLGNDGSLVVWRRHDDRKTTIDAEKTFDVEVLPDGRRAAVLGRNEVAVFALEKGTMEQTIGVPGDEHGRLVLDRFESTLNVIDARREAARRVDFDKKTSLPLGRTIAPEWLEDPAPDSRLDFVDQGDRVIEFRSRALDESSVELEILVAHRDERLGSRTLWRSARANPPTKHARIRVSEASGEIYFHDPTIGLWVVSPVGGLPVRLAPSGTLTSVAVLR